MCQGSGKYQKTQEDILRDEAEAELLKDFEILGDRVKCRTCKNLIIPADAEDHKKWHKELLRGITLTGPWTELGKRNLHV